MKTIYLSIYLSIYLIEKKQFIRVLYLSFIAQFPRQFKLQMACVSISKITQPVKNGSLPYWILFS